MVHTVPGLTTPQWESPSESMCALLLSENVRGCVQHAAAFLSFRPRTGRRKVRARSLTCRGQQCWGMKPHHMPGWGLAAVPVPAPLHHREPCLYRYGTAALVGRRTQGWFLSKECVRNLTCILALGKGWQLP